LPRVDRRDALPGSEYSRCRSALAGLVISDSPESSEVRRRLLPFRDLFAVMFFVAVGTLLDPAALGGGLGWLALFMALLLGTKTLVVWALARAAGISRPAQVAVGLSQIGEFSFVLASVLFVSGVITVELHAALLAVVALSIGISAVAVRLSVPGWTRGASPTLG